jgi:hypothetical protein
MPDGVPPGWRTISLDERNAVRHAGLVSGMAILQQSTASAQVGLAVAFAWTTGDNVSTVYSA